ncbi:uncharacterized protein PV09_03588 [Verruconis gallopava]|uniref:Arginine N-methyltransferase 2 n=1 Tax=Verruconis gallopava TaxID=253628 RepID=A0A0D1XSJ9_9PEZI|nr:uncharacterized protein PV09_03588 [Verruconis gallopava]KIW05731.1 hypothetical protein PV09_03588 [Verruconis gallopava]
MSTGVDNEVDPLESVDVDLSAQSLLLAAANHDLEAIKDLLKTTPATVQDADTGFTPLHAAVAACEQAEDISGANEESREGRKAEISKAADTVRLLLQSGAIWNDLDAANETPGCIAKRLGLDELYRIIVDAGVRAELLLSKLDEYEPLGDGEDPPDDETGEENPSGEGQHRENEHPALESDPSASNAAYLRSAISFNDASILDSAANGVMMSWERPIMERHASLLCQKPGLRVLNVGHGMGIIDEFFQSHSPSTHHIIEAHPDVLVNMRTQGWMEKPGVVVHEGRWQDVLPELVAGGENATDALFDVIYFDTFAEDYKASRDFFSEWVVQLLDSDGKFSFFNGMGADRQVCYDVYNKVVEIDLFEAGFDVDWEDVPIADLAASGEWDGVRRPYWSLKVYRLPTCKFLT